MNLMKRLLQDLQREMIDTTKTIKWALARTEPIRTQCCDNKVTTAITKLNLEHFRMIYEQAFGQHPDSADLSDAFRFVSLFLQDVNKTCPGSFATIRDLQILVGQFHPMTIAKRMAMTKLPKEKPPPDMWFEP
jgi:hypothetical protein